MAEKKDWGNVIYAYALKNAVEHSGKAQIGAVISGLFHEGLKKEELGEIIPDVKKTIEKVNSMSASEQEKEFEKFKKEVSERQTRKEGELPELENAVEGKVVMRIAPFPSGPLHIGNTRQLVLNDEYAKKYKGKLLLFMDDTIGSEEKRIVPESYKLIEKGVKWMKVKYVKPMIYKSKRLKVYYKYAKELILRDKAYVCSCPAEKLRENRAGGIECACRKNSVKENLELWKRMFKAKEGSFTLRLKTDMKHPNPAFRDRVLFRISDREHPIVKNKVRVWPTLEMTWAVDDYEFGITHIIRGKELMIETDMEKYIFDIFGWKHPVFIHTGLLQFEGIKLSKSKGQKEVREGRYIGWDDPRTWSLQSLEKRGIQPEAIRKFIIGLGVNQNEITVPIDILYAENRKILAKIAKGYNFQESPGGNIRILMPDGKIVSGNSDLKPKDNKIVFFRGVGFCKFDKEKKLFYFTHR